MVSGPINLRYESSSSESLLLQYFTLQFYKEITLYDESFAVTKTAVTIYVS